MINPFTRTEEDEFATGDLMANRRPLSNFESPSEPTINFPDNRKMEIESTENPERLTQDIGKLSQAYKEFVGEEFQPFTAEQELEMQNYQAQEFAKARQERATEIEQEEKTAVADYQQRVAQGIEPVRETIDWSARAEKAYRDELGKLNNARIQILADPTLAGTKASGRALKAIEQQMVSLEGMHQLNLETLGGKAYVQAPTEVKEVYNNNFMGAVREGMVNPSDAIRYSTQHIEVLSKVQPVIDNLISEGKNQEAQELSNRVFGRERVDALGRPLPGREGGLVKMTNFGTFQYNTDSKIFDENLNNTLVNLGVKRAEKPLDLFKQEEDLLKSRVNITQDRLKLVPEEDEATREELTNIIKTDQETLSKINDARSKAIGQPTAQEMTEISKQEGFQKELNELNQFVPTEDNGRETYNTKATSIVEKYNVPLIEAKNQAELLQKRKGLNPGDFYAFKLENQPITFKQVPEANIQRAEELQVASDQLINSGIAKKVKDGYLVATDNVSDKDKKRIDRYNETLRNIQFGS